MDSQPNIDLKFVAQLLKISVDQVQSAVTLLDEENTIPFIARYRRDETGGLYESQLRRIKDQVNRARALNERKLVIRKSIDSQGKLDDDVARRIDAAKSSRELEDVYLPFKPQKQTQAELARQRGLEPLARDLLEATVTGDDLPKRSEQFVRVDKGLDSIDAVIEGVHHLLVEAFSQNVDVRHELRRQIGEAGLLVSKAIDAAGDNDNDSTRESNRESNKLIAEAEKDRPASTTARLPKEAATPANNGGNQLSTASKDSQSSSVAETPQSSAGDPETAVENPGPENPGPENSSGENQSALPQEDKLPEISAAETAALTDGVAESKQTEIQAAGSTPPQESNTDEAASGSVTAEKTAAEGAESDSAESDSAESGSSKSDSAKSEGPSSQPGPTEGASPESAVAAKSTGTITKSKPRKKKPKKKKNAAKENVFAEFADFRERLKKIPPHRILAINRGERAGKLKVTIEPQNLSLDKLIAEKVVADDHPFKEVLTKAAKDSLNKTILPAVIREVRRDLTEHAENHAVRVFARNLRQLLIQRPVAAQKILAIDPGFRTGCKVAVNDETGKPLETGRFFIVGKQDRLDEGRSLISRLVTEHDVTLIAIGNGAGCRATEHLVSDLLAKELKDTTTNYVIVNQAGASAYSTCELAREELPDHDPIFRSAISIGRRLLDPLSELVKIHPSNIGVGMYQHDIKGKHLQDSLDDEVESSVNFVGVDLNTASTALLKYAAGLNQMTARRIVEFRNTHGAFKNRQQLKEVQGIGDKTFTQCAGFLRVFDGDQPLDATPIHPESYEVAEKILIKVGTDSRGLLDAANQYSQQSQSLHQNPDELPKSSWQDIRRKVRELDLQKTADELGVGKLLVEDLVRCLMRPSRDPRHDFQSLVQRRSIMSVEELEVNKELRGQIVNVVDFGVFVDIGLGTSSLVHISQLSQKFIHDLHLAYSIGDILTVWVLEIDKPRKQVKLTAIRPAGLSPSRPPRSRNRKFEGKSKNKKFRGKPNRERRPAKPKPPPPPITKDMVEGKKPMRSFSDLAQFFDKKPEDSDKK